MRGRRGAPEGEDYAGQNRGGERQGIGAVALAPKAARRETLQDVVAAPGQVHGGGGHGRSDGEEPAGGGAK